LGSKTKVKANVLDGKSKAKHIIVSKLGLFYSVIKNWFWAVTPDHLLRKVHSTTRFHLV